MSITKSDFRNLCIKRLQKFSKKSIKFAVDKKIQNEIFKFVKTYKFKKVLIYLPLDLEVDICDIIKKMRQKGIKLFTTKMVGDSLEVVPFRLPLKKKRFNILEAKRSFYYKTDFDLAIIPIIGVDSSLRRIGFGKGFYDRFFASLKFRPIVLFTQRTLCFAKDNVTSLYDISADLILTKEGVLWRL